MKKILTFILFSITNILIFAQINSFNYETDVNAYFDFNRSFRNKDNSLKLNFSDMGTYFTVGNSTYFNPEIEIISSTKAIVSYLNANSPNRKIELLIDLQRNGIIDLSDKSFYLSNNYQFPNEENNKVTLQPKKYNTTNKKHIKKK